VAALSVPLFDEYLKRAMTDWQAPKRRLRLALRARRRRSFDANGQV